MKDTPLTSRADLEFDAAVARHFAFLRELGFERVESGPTLVRFQSWTVCLVVWHGRRSYEIHLEIGPRGRRDESYPFGAILRLMHGKDTGYRAYAARTRELVEKGVQQLSARFRACLDGGLAIDDDLFRQLEVARDKGLREYEIQIRLEHARERVPAAWQAKDFPRVVGLLAPFRELLSPAERKKLEYAEKRAKPSGRGG